MKTKLLFVLFLCGLIVTSVLLTHDVVRATGQTEKPVGVIKGMVTGLPLNLKDAIFMWRDKADDMSIVLSDTDKLCENLISGNMPRNGTVLFLLLKHNTHENRDAPFAPGEYPLRTKGPRQAQDTKRATFMKLDAACGNTIARDDAVANAGMVKLTSIEAKPGGIARGSLKFTFGTKGDTLDGEFSARFCEMPSGYMEPRGCK